MSLRRNWSFWLVGAPLLAGAMAMAVTTVPNMRYFEDWERIDVGPVQPARLMSVTGEDLLVEDASGQLQRCEVVDQRCRWSPIASTDELPQKRGYTEEPEPEPPSPPSRNVKIVSREFNPGPETSVELHYALSDTGTLWRWRRASNGLIFFFRTIFIPATAAFIAFCCVGFAWICCGALRALRERRARKMGDESEDVRSPS